MIVARLHNIIVCFFMLEHTFITVFQVLEEIYPVGTYSHFALLIVVFLVTDLLRHKPVIVAEGIMGIAIWTLLLWGQGIPLMQVSVMLFSMCWCWLLFLYMYSTLLIYTLKVSDPSIKQKYYCMSINIFK